MVQARLNGYLDSDFDAALMPVIDLANPRPQPPPPDFGPMEILNARREGDIRTEAERFAEDGFVLLSHATNVRDWDNDIERVYLPEIEAIVRNRLFPGQRVEIQQRASLVRRGRGTSHPYAGGIHSDGPLSANDYALNVRAFAGPQAENWWRAQYDRKDVRGFVNIDFWRTTNMTQPLRHMPLALCRPHSLERADVVPATMKGIAPEGRESHHLMLRYNPGQAWAYFPEMRSDEVLAFKLCEFWKDQPDARPQNVFHTAFADPGTPPDVEERQSCEHRVGVLILRD